MISMGWCKFKIQYIAFSYFLTSMTLGIISFVQDYLHYLHDPNHIPFSPLFHVFVNFLWLLVPFPYKLWIFGIVLFSTLTYTLLKADSKIKNLREVNAVINVGAGVTVIILLFFAFQNLLALIMLVHK